MIKKFIVGGAIAMIVTSPTTGVDAQTNAPATSISISPDLYIPEQEEWAHEIPSTEDVKRTMNLQEIDLATTTALAEIDMGVEEMLGYPEHELKPNQVRLYNQLVEDYSKRIMTIGETATKAEEVEEVLAEFQQWVREYSDAVLKDREIAIANRKLEEQERAERLAKIKEEEGKLGETTIVTSVVEETVEEELTPQPDIESAKVSFGIPELGRQYLTYMPHRTITSKSSYQWKLQQIAETNEEGYRTVKGMKMIALASSYGTKMGTVYDITFANGDVLRAVLGDAKADAHTDSRKQYRDATGVYDGSSGNILEMILDDSKFESVNQANRKINGDYPTKIISIVKVGEVEGF